MTTLSPEDPRGYVLAVFPEIRIDSIARTSTGANLCFEIATVGQGRFFLKAGPGRRAGCDGHLLAEGLFYAAARRHDLASARVDVPRAVLHDRRNDVLLLRAVDGELLGLAQHPPGNADLHAIGVALARFHTWGTRVLATEPGALGRAWHPIVPDTEPPTLEEYARLAEAELRILSLLAGNPGIKAALDRLRATPPSTIVHGDLRPHNIVMSDGAPTFIDWEFVQPGVPEADIGTFIGSLLDGHLDEVEHDADRQDAPACVEGITRARARAFLDGYRSEPRGRPIDGATLDHWVGLHLLHRISANLRTTGLPRRSDRRRLQLALRYLLTPSARAVPRWA